MKIDDIITLSKAGFTKDEIMQLVTGQASENEETKTEDKKNDEQPIIEKPQVQEPEPVKDPRIDDVISKLEKLTSGMEKLAIKTSEMPKRETTEEALASIINPYLSTGTGGIENGSK